MSARSRALQYPLIGTRTQAPMTDSAPTYAPTVLTATGQSMTIDVDEYTEGLLFVSTTAVSGTTPSLTFALQTSPDGVLWAPIGPAIVAITAAGTVALPFGATTAGGPFGYHMRLAFTLTGTTPSFTIAAWFIGK